VTRFLQLVLLLHFSTLRLFSADVLQHHADGGRDGLYIDPAFTQSAAPTLRRDPAFYAALPGQVYAQPLYVSNGPGGRSAFIVATEQNTVVAIDASTGFWIWSRNVGTPVSLSLLACGNIDPFGITGTPVIDPDARTIYLDAATTPDGVTQRHLIYALSLDDGSTLPGWPVDPTGIVSQGVQFDSTYQGQRGALLLVGGILYVPYGGLAGDCGDYHGWVIGVPVNDPAHPTGWATAAVAGGIWAPGGLATDGTSVFVATGNTEGAANWMGGEAIVRLGAGATFSGDPADYFVPSNWVFLDAADLDLGGSGPLLVDVAGAVPSQLVVALGKNGVAYLLDRNNLGGFGSGDGASGEGLESARVSSDSIVNAAASYTTASGTYVVMKATAAGIGCPGAPGDLIALRIAAASPPSISVAWCADNLGGGSPIVTTTDGSSQPIVWTVGAEYTNQLHGYDGETGRLLFTGGGPFEQMGNVEHFQTPIVVDGRIFVAGDNQLYAFTLNP
jgi:outer membrane protein assembly factor BamB